MKPIESKRVALDRKIVLRFPDFDGFVTEFAANLSMTGMFVRSEEPQRAGTPVAFELRLEDGAPLVRGSGWVVWSRNRSETADRPAGMGIEFTELDHKSRRLVRWMIHSELHEGGTPYDVRAGGGDGTVVSRSTSRASVGGWRIPVVAGLLFASLAALILWRGFGAPRAAHEASSTGLPAPTPLQAEALEVAGRRAMDQPSEVTQARGALGPEPGHAGAGRGPDHGPESSRGPGEVAARAAVEEAVRNWARTWSDQDVDGYLGHYASDFEPGDGLSRRQWRDQRRQRITAPESIRVAVTRLETTMVSDGEARVTLLQTYRSDGYADTVDKMLDLVLEDGAWRIRREEAD